MAHDGSADDAVLASQLDERVIVFQGRGAVLLSDDIAHVAMVSGLGVRAAVGDAFGVEVGAGGLAALRKISELMDVEAVVAGLEASHLGLDVGLATLRLGEETGSLDA